MKGLYLMFEGLPPTVIDAVTLRHIAAMGASHGVAFSLVTVACSAGLWRRSQARLAAAREIAGCDVALLRGAQPSMPGSVRMNAGIVTHALGPLLATFDFIHARTDYSAAVAGALPAAGRPPIIWDCRGDTRAEIVEAQGQDAPLRRRLLAPLRLYAAERHRRAAAKTAAGAIFVSGALRARRGADLSADENVLVAPNCADEDVFFLSPELRERTRRALGVTQDELLFVYSGGMSGYQRIEDTLRWFATAARKIPESRLLLLTPETDAMRVLVDRLALPVAPIIRSAAHAEVNAYLNAADAAFMLRHRNATNRVASPTKFAEYCMAGLPVVMSDAVEGAVALAQRIGNLVPEDAPDALARIAAIDRVAVAAQAAAALGRTAQGNAIFDLYRRVVSPAAGFA